MCNLDYFYLFSQYLSHRSASLIHLLKRFTVFCKHLLHSPGYTKGKAMLTLKQANKKKTPTNINCTMSLKGQWNDFKSQCSHKCTRFQELWKNYHVCHIIFGFSAVKMKMICSPLSKPSKSKMHQILRTNTHTDIV